MQDCTTSGLSLVRVTTGRARNVFAWQKSVAELVADEQNSAKHNREENDMVHASMFAFWQNSLNPLAGFFSGGVLMFGLAAAIIAIIGGWKTFEKAGQPGWACIIPIFNVYIMLKIAGRPGWWLLLYLIPIVNIVIAIIVAIDIAKAFGQGPMFGFLLLFVFAVIGYLVLGFGNYQYRKPAAMAAIA
jgi:Family of unknown function (DUF5684)